ncbi:MAG: TonB-dependent receptor [Bacteroidetes bacterium]|nr:MAG: TonB-dependent receptor [Bacteroidota bacterium]
MTQNNIEREVFDTNRKALFINLDDTIYGSFAEIGGGQEVARCFFQSGGASGTVAKTISAYDMIFSDTLYGKTPKGRYVSESRLMQMLDIEYDNLVKLLADKRGGDTRFFAFANTVTTINYQKTNEGHGWLGVRFQLKPESPPNDVILHVKLLEKDNLLQQKTLGILGVNLLYACYYNYQYPNSFLKSLVESNLEDRVDIDMISMRGPDLDYVDNRLLAVQLVKNNMTAVTMFDRYGNVKPPSELLYKKNVMLLRGSFRPITYVGFDMLKSGFSVFKKEVGFEKENTVVLCEMTLKNLLEEGVFDERDFLDRVDILCGMGQNVMITNFKEFYKISNWFRKYKIHNIRMVIGALTFRKILEKKYYNHLRGGILEAFGRLFSQNLKVYLYPGREKQTHNILTSENLPVEPDVKFLYQHLLESGLIIDIKNYRKEILPFFSYKVLAKLNANDPEWEDMVPKYVSSFIKNKNLFGYGSKKKEPLIKENKP